MTPVFNFLNKVWILIRDNTQLENVWANFLGGLSLVVFYFSGMKYCVQKETLPVSGMSRTQLQVQSTVNIII